MGRGSLGGAGDERLALIEVGIEPGQGLVQLLNPGREVLRVVQREPDLTDHFLDRRTDLRNRPVQVIEPSQLREQDRRLREKVANPVPSEAERKQASLDAVNEVLQDPTRALALAKLGAGAKQHFSGARKPGDQAEAKLAVPLLQGSRVGQPGGPGTPAGPHIPLRLA